MARKKLCTCSFGKEINYTPSIHLTIHARSPFSKAFGELYEALSVVFMMLFLELKQFLGPMFSRSFIAQQRKDPTCYGGEEKSRKI